MSIIVNHLQYIYNPNTTFSKAALKDVSFKVEDGEYIGLVGHTGSGKSTLVQHLNGLIKPTDGGVYYNGEDIWGEDYDRRELCGKVGLVFQYPEHQLFEEDVFSDVCFGPKNLGLSKAEYELRAYDALKSVGLKDESFYVSPFDLSGGEKRRVAIAGVLAMKPEVLVLDEPTAGLDPQGKEDILNLIDSLHESLNITIILVSHSMDDLAEHVNRMIVISDGQVALDGDTRSVFSKNREYLESIGLGVPAVTAIASDLRSRGWPVRKDILTVEEAKQDIINCLSRRRH